MRVLTALARLHGGDGWRETSARTLAAIARHLNGWSTARLLHAFAAHSVDMRDAYVLGQWSPGRWLRFVPMLGEYVASSVLLVFQKRPGHCATSYNGVLRRMVSVYAGRRRQRAV